jgi:hypothetical protein
MGAAELTSASAPALAVVRPAARRPFASRTTSRWPGSRWRRRAAGGSPCGVGTDSGASVRLPAHFCGLAAPKATAGRVPVTGILDEDGRIGASSDPRTQPGPLARSVGAVALLLRLIAGTDGDRKSVV